MSQYREIKNRYRDGILLFQVGDFYETFYEDAKDVARLLNIALTTRDKKKKDPIPLAGVPIHAADTYIAKLLQAGKKVVICDQVGDAAGVKGIVKRKVTDIITPGTTLTPSTLTEKENNYLVSLVVRSGRVGFAVCDLSTGEFSAGEEPDTYLINIIGGYTFKEAVIPEGSDELRRMIAETGPGCTIEELPPFHFGEQTGRETLCKHFGVGDLACFGLDDKPFASAAAGALLGFIKDLRQNKLRHITRIRLIISDERLFLDTETLRNLEVFEPLRGNSPDTTLIHHLDRTETAAGAREIRQWIKHPLRKRIAINRRLDGLTSFFGDQASIREVRRLLKRFPDIERILSRITAKKAGPRELLALADALERAPALGEAARHMKAGIIEEAVASLTKDTEAGDIIAGSIDPACPPHLRDGCVIRKGFDPDLDTLIERSEEGRTWIASLQETERLKTGIPSLKVGFNKVFGYYIEVSRIHEAKVPETYIGKQTLVSSQRYVTEQLKVREQAILTAEARRIELEKTIFFRVCERLADESARLQEIAEAVSTLDCLSSLAEIALEWRYCRPELNESNDLVITDGRHPVVERIAGSSFIPNDLVLRPDEKQVLIITGPNMGGKSTFIRQAAIIALLAHAGCYVPASRAVVGLLDRIFTRVGSSDNLARGQSTFLVEMSETAKILHNCTSRSLVLLDEVGRGTSTLDGLSLAWAVTEYLLENDRVRPKTLFATHYHELTHLAHSFPRIGNLRVEVKEWGDTILFLYKIRPGASDKSYGIHVAALAGLPGSVIERAEEILTSLESQEDQPVMVTAKSTAQTSLFNETDPIREKLQSIVIEEITPLDAIKMLADLKRTSDEM